MASSHRDISRDRYIYQYMCWYPTAQLRPAVHELEFLRSSDFIPASALSLNLYVHRVSECSTVTSSSRLNQQTHLRMWMFLPTAWLLVRLLC